MKTPMVSSATSFQRLQTSLQSPMPRLPRSNVYSTQDPANPSASVHRKRFFTPSLTLKFLCAGYLNRGHLQSNGGIDDLYDRQILALCRVRLRLGLPRGQLITAVLFSYLRQIFIKRPHPGGGQQPFPDRPLDGVGKLTRKRRARALCKTWRYPNRKIQSPLGDDEQCACDQIIVASHDPRPLIGVTSADVRGAVPTKELQVA